MTYSTRSSRWQIKRQTTDSQVTKGARSGIVYVCVGRRDIANDRWKGLVHFLSLPDWWSTRYDRSSLFHAFWRIWLLFFCYTIRLGVLWRSKLSGVTSSGRAVHEIGSPQPIYPFGKILLITAFTVRVLCAKHPSYRYIT